MTDFIQIQWTCDDIEEAKKISKHLIQKNLVACANIISDIESFFMWEGELNEAQEIKVLFKTIADNFDDVKNIILEKASYDVPEILSFKIEEGHEKYLQWVKESCNKN